MKREIRVRVAAAEHAACRIPPEDARDLSTIRSNLEKGNYSTYRQVDEDIELMLQNARIFNGEGEVSNAADAFGKWWDQQRKKMD